ncbi:hypothetical protein SDC9_126619 [bioreactor metagenome]|uniref:Uncharacterized protein n=1 Tax=bioreactor metagenome TaxID=1076179 RepID=A0A645CR57_9ZZZZ
MRAVRARAESAGRFADVLGKIDPTLWIDLHDPVGIILAQNRYGILDHRLRFLDRYFRRIFRIQRDLQVGISHLVQSADFLQVGDVFLHHRG